MESNTPQTTPRAPVEPHTSLMEKVNNHLMTLAPLIAKIKVTEPSVWETSYNAAEDVTGENGINSIVLVEHGDVSSMTADELAVEMKKIKHLWHEWGMYSIEQYVDPNPRVQSEMQNYSENLV
tara:strand:- start:1183 stop:1551 length:369 start_codon:yes stop_codon:yes gene_type:complete